MSQDDVTTSSFEHLKPIRDQYLAITDNWWLRWAGFNGAGFSKQDGQWAIAVNLEHPYGLWLAKLIARKRFPGVPFEFTVIGRIRAQ